jgi:hypothetical protein
MNMSKCVMFIGNLGGWEISICLDGKSKLPQILEAHVFCLRWKSQGASMDAIHQMHPKWRCIFAHIYGFQCPMALWNSSQSWQTSTSMTFTYFIFFLSCFYSCLFVHVTMHFCKVVELDHVKSSLVHEVFQIHNINIIPSK